jgi:hypothetical protein
MVRGDMVQANGPKEKVVYIYNMSEDVWPFIDSISDVREKIAEIDENEDLVDRELLSTSDENNLVFISPKEIDLAFLEYFQALFGRKQLEILIPKRHSGMICKDILADHELFDRLVRIGNSVRRLILLSYTTSPYFLKLVEYLRSRGVAAYTPESPETEDGWTVNFFGSKSGIRQLAQKSSALEPDFLMPDGLICVGPVDAAKIAASKYVKEDGVVIKTNKGHSGAGVLIFREGQLPSTYEQCRKTIYTILKRNEYWEKFPIIIESLINVNHAVGGGFPNVEFKIKKSGEIEFLYFCGLRVSKEGIFQGVEMNEDVITGRLQASITDLGFFIGEQYAAAGYRGYYDVDLVCAKNGKIYVNESNVRRTGGSYVHKAALRLIGKDFLTDSYVLSNNTYRVPSPQVLAFTQIHEVLSPLLFSRKTKEGVIIASANRLRHGVLSYIIFGNTKKRALEIESRMKDLLASS